MPSKENMEKYHRRFMALIDTGRYSEPVAHQMALHSVLCSLMAETPMGAPAAAEADVWIDWPPAPL